MIKHHWLGILLIPTVGWAQNGILEGVVLNDVSNEPIPFSTVYIPELETGVASDITGAFMIDLAPGNYSVNVSSIGFETTTIYEVQVGTSKPTYIEVRLVEAKSEIDDVIVYASPFNKTEESPVSLRTISAAEILRNPGGNRDISKVIQSFPGVGTTVSFRNDLIVRGGAPNENRFYLDGVEVPNINHFATQGSSGGPVGMINVNFIREVDFLSSAFPSNRGNTLSSVMEFSLNDGSRDQFAGSVLVGSSDVGLTLEGPTGERSEFILSLRRSYLQFLFKALKLPFLPTYNDLLYKHTFRVNERNRITVLALGAIDDFELNSGVNDGVTDADVIERNNYVLGNLPVNSQWNYTVGAKWQHFNDNSYQTIVVSRNHLNNSAVKYANNTGEPADLLLDYESAEIENKVRVEHTVRSGAWKLNVGVLYELAEYTTNTFQVFNLDTVRMVRDLTSSVNISKYGLFAQASWAQPNGPWSFTIGLRADGNDLNSEMANPVDQLSPRLGATYRLSANWSLNMSVGRYFQLPAYTVLGYRDATGALLNADNGITYIGSDHLVGGLEFNPSDHAKITVEGFYKNYSNYPFLTTDSITLANLGGDFGVIGNEPAVSSSDGRSYGIEVMAQQKLSSSVYGILAYTWVRSEFEDKNGNLVPSAWDNQHILSVTAGKRFKNNWEVGARFALLGGAPYTPFDLATTSNRTVWDINRQAVLDWDRLNTERLPLTHRLDIRVDKKWFFNNWSLNIYLDIQNVYGYVTELPPYLTPELDGNGDPLIDPTDPSRYVMKQIMNEAGNVLPSIGVMIDF